MPNYNVTDEGVIEADPSSVFKALVDEYSGISHWWMPYCEIKSRGDEKSFQKGSVFDVTVRRVETKEEVHLTADTGWSQVELIPPTSGRTSTTLRWHGPRDKSVAAVSVEVEITPTEGDALEWAIRVDNPSDQWSVWRVVFPQIAVADLGLLRE